MKKLIVLCFLLSGCGEDQTDITNNYYYDYSIDQIIEICNELNVYEFKEIKDGHVKVYHDGTDCRITIN